MKTLTSRQRSAVPTMASPALAIIASVLLVGCAPELAPTASPAESQREMTYRAGDVLIQIPDPVGWEVRTDTRERVVGFDDRTSDATAPLGYSGYGVPTATDAHGIVVADLTGVDFHNDRQPPPAHTAAEFLENLASLDMGSASEPSYTVGPIEPTEIGGRPALTAPIEANTGYALFEGANGHLALDLSVPHRVIVTDVGDSILLVQIWAKSNVDLAAWLPRAEELLDRMVFASDR